MLVSRRILGTCTAFDSRYTLNNTSSLRETTEFTPEVFKPSCMIHFWVVGMKWLFYFQGVYHPLEAYFSGSSVHGPSTMITLEVQPSRADNQQIHYLMLFRWNIPKSWKSNKKATKNMSSKIFGGHPLGCCMSIDIYIHPRKLTFRT